MSDISTTRIFTDGERGITAQKLNDIVGSSVIQPAFYTNKPTAGTADPADVALILKAGAYAQVPISALAGSATQAQIWSTRLRSFNAIGNPNFEVDQRTVGAGTGTVGNVFALDRWVKGNQLIANYSVAQNIVNPPISIPSTNFGISRAFARFTLLVQKVSLAASDHMYIQHNVEAPLLRELINDVNSVSLLVRSNVAPLTFSISLRDSVAGYSLVQSSTIPTVNVWTILTLPNLPVWSSSGNFPLAAGNLGYSMTICLAAGVSFTAPAAGTWQSGNWLGAPGMSNFAASPVNSTFDIAFVQHEPGPVCSTFMDKPFSQNLDECLRYYAKSYSYAVAAGTASAIGQCAMYCPASLHPVTPIRFKKTMAKAPTVTGYSPVSGAINNLRDNTAVLDKAINGASSVGDDGFSGFTVTSPNAAAWQSLSHYTADTGW